MKKIYVIGIGYRPLEKRAGDVLCGSDVLLLNTGLLEVLRDYEYYNTVKDKIKVINGAHQTVDYIRDNHGDQIISVIASGDPMFFGIGRIIINEFGREGVEIYPDLSSMQVAFSRIKEPWSEAFLMSLHGGPDPNKRRRTEYEITDLPALLEKHSRIGILTDKVNDPSSIADLLRSSPVSRSLTLDLYVCQKLGYPDEEITEGSPDKIAGRSFPRPNVLIILKRG